MKRKTPCLSSYQFAVHGKRAGQSATAAGATHAELGLILSHHHENVIVAHARFILGGKKAELIFRWNTVPLITDEGPARTRKRICSYTANSYHGGRWSGAGWRVDSPRGHLSSGIRRMLW